MKIMNVIDLFCGCGGLSEGFEDAGFNIAIGNDIDRDMVESYRLNHPHSKAIKGDITKISSDQLLNGTKIKKNNISAIIGGPPCQGFSTVGNRKKNDPRNRLFYQFARIVKEISPPVFVLENVTGLLTMQKGKVKEMIINEFEKLGYKVSYKILKSEEYAVPQKRRRVFFVGNRIKDGVFHFPEPTHGLDKLPLVTVWDAISDLPAIESGKSADRYDKSPNSKLQTYLRDDETILIDHKSPKHTNLMIKRMQNIKQGQNHSNLPKKLQLEGGYPNIYGRLISNQPSDTITGNCGCISAPGKFIHPFNNRALTVREAARLQSFKDSKRFVGSQSKKYRQVGNSVPPLMAKALAIEIKKLFD